MNLASLFDFSPLLLSFVEVLPALAFESPSWPPWLAVSLCLFGQLLQLPLSFLAMHRLWLLSCRSAHRLSLCRSTFCNPFLDSRSSIVPCQIRISSTIWNTRVLSVRIKQARCTCFATQMSPKAVWSRRLRNMQVSRC